MFLPHGNLHFLLSKFYGFISVMTLHFLDAVLVSFSILSVPPRTALLLQPLP